ncbi:MAG TPA: CopD family protein [Burkholderiales bacterium]
MQIPVFLHVLSVTVWVGGMFFAYMCLRPVAARVLEPPQRLRLWDGTFALFFPWVWAAVALILASGLYMIWLMGGFAAAPHHVHAMFGLGLTMMLIYFHVYFLPYRRLRRAVAAGDWKAGGAALGQIRKLVGINLALGLLTIAIAILGRLLP